MYHSCGREECDGNERVHQNSKRQQRQNRADHWQHVNQRTVQRTSRPVCAQVYRQHHSHEPHKSAQRTAQIGWLNAIELAIEKMSSGNTMMRQPTA